MPEPVNMAEAAKGPAPGRRLCLLLLIMLVLLLLTALLAVLPEREVVLPGGIALTHTHTIEVAEDTGYLACSANDPYLVLQTPKPLASVSRLRLEVDHGAEAGMVKKTFSLYFQPVGKTNPFSEKYRLSSPPVPGPAGSSIYRFNLPEPVATCRLDPPAGIIFRIRSLTWHGHDRTGKESHISITTDPPQVSENIRPGEPLLERDKPGSATASKQAVGTPPPAPKPAATKAAPVPRPEAPAVGLRRECCQLQKEIESLPQQQRPEVLGLRLRAQYILEDLEVWARAWQKSHETGIRQRLNALQDHLSKLQQNGTYLATDSTCLMAHQSPLDDSLQPYALSIGKGINPRGDRVHPLVVYLHGQGMYLPRQFTAPRWAGYIVVGPQGRGGMDYRYVGEVDVLQVIEEARELLPVDPNRIVLAGGSMGGTGCWHLATRFPDLFAGIAAVNGITDIKPVEAGLLPSGAEPSPQQQIRHFLRHDTAPVSRAGNLLHLSIRAWHGMDDPINPAYNALNMRAALQGNNHPRLDYHLVPYGLHQISVNYPAAVQDFVRTPTPEHISLGSAWLKYGQAWWVRYDALEQPLRPAQVDGTCEKDGSRVVLTTENLKALTLLPRFMPGSRPPRRVIIDGTAIWIKEGEGSHSKDRQLHFYRINPDGPWLAREELSAEGFPPPKTGALEGPVEHAFMSRFMVVLPDPPAANAPSPLVRAARKAGLDFDRWWHHRFSVPCRRRNVSEVTEADLADSNLILYGGPDENPLVRQVIGKLPVRPLPEGILLGAERLASAHLGARLCFPNPLNPERYVVLTFGLTPESYHQVHRRFGNWFDWVPYFHRDHYDFAVWDAWTTGQDPETFLRWGFFDQSWQLEAELTFNGVGELRQSLRPYMAPAIDRAALATVRQQNPGKAVPVEMLEPVVSTVAKDCIERRRNQHGGALQLAGKTYESGLSLTYPAKLVLPCTGYRLLRGNFGLQWDGKTAWPANRLAQAEPEITVIIGGKTIMTLQNITLSKPALNVAIPLQGAEEVTLVISGGPPWGGETLVMGNTFLVP